MSLLTQSLKSCNQSGGFIEDVFSTNLYTGNSSTQTITNGIDLSTKGGLVWTKRRDTTGYGNYFIDTVRGAPKTIESNASTAQTSSYTDSLTSFTSSGYVLGADAANGGFNNGAGTFVSWSFRKQAKFFDIVTYTGNGVARTIAHNLGSTPGCIIVKCTSSGFTDWRVYHVGLTSAAYTIQLNQTSAQTNQPSIWNSTAPTSSVFSVGGDPSVNSNGDTYVAYLFAHNAGGFGYSGSENAITCGAYTGTGVLTDINLGFEPQWILWKSIDYNVGWYIYDNKRGLPAVDPTGTVDGFALQPNSTTLENPNGQIAIYAEGFTLPTSNPYWNNSGNKYIYIAIRRGPMKTPTSATQVFSSTYQTTNNTAQSKDLSLDPDIIFSSANTSTYVGTKTFSRLQGRYRNLTTYSLSAETVGNSDNIIGWDYQNGVRLGVDSGYDIQAGFPHVLNSFKRAPGFCDVVCYTGNNTYDRSIKHNLGVVPEFIILKVRSGSDQIWTTYHKNKTGLALNYDYGTTTYDTFGYSGPNMTSTTFSVGGLSYLGNESSRTYVAYLFASLSGISNVGSYSNGASASSPRTINCGFSTGARFIIIKNISVDGTNWYMWDSSRGIITASEPRLSLNVSTGYGYDDSIDPDNSGFIVNNISPTNLNAAYNTYMYFAVA